MINKCPHEFTDQLLAVQADAMCPLCMEIEIKQLRAALEDASDLAVALCAECRKNIGNRQFINWCHDHVGVGIINICNAAVGESEDGAGTA